MLLSAALVLTLCISCGIAASAVVDYSSQEAIDKYGDSGLHVVLVFHTTEARENVLQDLIQPLSLNQEKLSFVLVDRQQLPHVARNYYLPSDVPECYIMVIPPGKKSGIHIPPGNIPYTLQSLSHLLASMVNGPDSQKLNVLAVDGRNLPQTLASMSKNVIAAVCWNGGSNQCNDFRLLLESTVTTEQRQYVEPIVVTVQNLKDVPGMIVPSINFYNISSHQWTMCESEITQCLANILNPSSLPKKAERVHPWMAEELKEDDYFGQMAQKEPPAMLPPSLFLTDKSFASHVTQYPTAVVVFCLKWSPRCKHVFHHVASAAKELEQGNNNNTSLKIVNCNDFPDVCALNGVTSYPTVLMFHGDVNHSQQYQGILDVEHLLEAVGLHQPSQQQLPLAELRPDTLPALFSSLPGSALVLFCMSQEKAEKTFQTHSPKNAHHRLSWAWVDSNYYPLLQKLVPSISDGSILILDFNEGKIYCNPLGPQQKPLTDFVEDFVAKRLKPDGMFAEKKWLPLQPPISFPSSEFENIPMKMQKAPTMSKMSDQSSKGHDEL